MYRKPDETFAAYLDRTLAGARETLISASEIYHTADEQRILNHVVSEIARKVGGEISALRRVRNREFC